jgi:hypothetical protein
MVSKIVKINTIQGTRVDRYLIKEIVMRLMFILSLLFVSLGSQAKMPCDFAAGDTVIVGAVLTTIGCCSVIHCSGSPSPNCISGYNCSNVVRTQYLGCLSAASGPYAWGEYTIHYGSEYSSVPTGLSACNSD